uniref:Carbohydrate sulfotransferase n=1 Tax=Phallusia mammillata TaxID=59560 RepID=A0A6F9D8S4_9ASCI|nr:carbohydrate sulfotransferase 10 [Phallusia mammillata]
MMLTKGKKIFAFLLMLSGIALFVERAGLYSTLSTSKINSMLQERQTVNVHEKTSPCPTFAPQATPTCPLLQEGMHPLSAEPPFSCRLQEIQRKCKERNLNSKFQRSHSFKYGASMPLLMCELPKVASTTWQAVLMKLNGFPGDVTKELLHRYAYSQFPHKTLVRVDDEQAERIIKQFTTFMITRHPFERLVSAYFDKFTNRSDMTSYRRNAGVKIARNQSPEFLHGIRMTSAVGDMVALKSSPEFSALGKQQQDDVIRYRHVLRSGEISFQQFIRHVLTHTRNVNSHTMDVHWRPQVLLCQPCALNYSMVMRFENLVTESNRLLKFVQRDLDINFTFPGANKPATQNTITAKAMQLISEADVNRLRDLYADDFYVLGHDPYRYSGKN